MTVLIKIIADSKTYRYSNVYGAYPDPDTSNTEFWSNKMSQIGSVHKMLGSNYGGFVRVTAGNINILPDGINFPPSSKIDITYYYYDPVLGTELVFSGVGRLTSVNKDGVSYSIHQENYTEKALEVASATDDRIINRDGEIIEGAVIPLYFGTEGVHTTRVPTNANLGVRKESISGDAANSARYYISNKGASQLQVYDDGALITDNITASTPTGEVRLEPIPVGEVTHTGDNKDGYGTLKDVFTWACHASRLNLTLNTTNARAISPPVSFEVKEQITIIDLLDNISRSFTHLFYIKSGTLYLVDMLSEATTQALTENKYIDANYFFTEATAEIKTSWTVKSPAVNLNKDPVNISIKKSQSVLMPIETGVELIAKNYFIEDEIFSGVRDNDQVKQNLKNIGLLIQRPRVAISLPMNLGFYDQGDKLTYTDFKLYKDIDIKCFVRSVSFDFDNEVINIEGDGENFGTISTPVDGASTYNESEEIKALLRFRNFITVENSSKARAHYTSLKDAVNDLKADGTGGTIFLRNGTYDEPDTIDLGNYKWIFEGESQAGVIIQKSSDNANPLFTFDANEKNILFANLTLRNDSGVTTASPVFLKGHATTTKAGVLHISGCKIDHDLGPVIIARKKDIQIFTCGINCTNLIDNPSSSSDGISIHIQNIALEDTNTGPTGSELFTIAGNDDDYLTLKDSRFTEVKNKVVNITKGGSMIVNNYIYMHAFTSTQTAENRKPIFIDSIEVNNIIGNYIKLDEPANDVELGIEAIHVMQSSSQQREGVVDNIIDLKLQLESTWVGFAWDVEGIELYGGQAVVMNNQAKIDLDTYSTSPIDVVGIKVKMNSGFGEKVNIFSNYLELVGTPTANSYGVELELDVDYCIIKNNHIKNFTTGVQDNSGKANNIIADNL